MCGKCHQPLDEHTERLREIETTWRIPGSRKGIVLERMESSAGFLQMAGRRKMGNEAGECCWA